VGLAIIILLIGIPIGLYMLLRPKKLWWTLSSWKYKNPEANEPSEAGYGMWALRGVSVIVATAILAWLAATKPDPADEKTQTVPWTQPSYSTTQPPPASAPQDRGELPIVDYRFETVGGSDGAAPRTNLAIFFLVPDGASVSFLGSPPTRLGGCEIAQQVEGLGTGRVTVDLRLAWSDRPGYYNATATDNEKCRLSGKWSQKAPLLRLADVAPGTTVLTNGAIVDRTGKVLTPAGPGNAVPERNA